jgi:hypothetical protein
MSGHKPWRELIKDFSPERKAQVEEKVKRLLANHEMLEDDEIFNRLQELCSEFPEDVRETAFLLILPSNADRIFAALEQAKSGEIRLSDLTTRI